LSAIKNIWPLIMWLNLLSGALKNVGLKEVHKQKDFAFSAKNLFSILRVEKIDSALCLVLGEELKAMLLKTENPCSRKGQDFLHCLKNGE
jgi:hypothetical protein